MCKAEWYADTEPCSLADSRRHIDRAAVQFHQLFHQRQADSRALVGPAYTPRHTIKPFEQMGHCIRRYSGSGITHGEFSVMIAEAQRHADLSLKGVFEGIG